jgi:hypothetical protein
MGVNSNPAISRNLFITSPIGLIECDLYESLDWRLIAIKTAIAAIAYW